MAEFRSHTILDFGFAVLLDLQFYWICDFKMHSNTHPGQDKLIPLPGFKPLLPLAFLESVQCAYGLRPDQIGPTVKQSEPE